MLIYRRTFLSLAAVTAAVPAFAFDGAQPARIETLSKFGSNGDPEPRIRVWLPASYEKADRPFRVLYMLDGQFAFANDGDGMNFAVDRRIARLVNTGSIEPTLIVAIDHLGDNRFLQYMPQGIYDQADKDVRATIEREISRLGATSLVSAQFIRFLKTQLKPYIDTHYRTSADRLNTAIFGASMGGVMAGAIFVEAQQDFGRAACMSPNWAVYDERMIDHSGLPAIWSSYFAQLGDPEGRRLWLDHGTEMMDAGMVPHQSAIAQSLANLRWRRGCNLQTRVYDAGHAFAQTATQMDEVLAWLLS